ncbi:MAG: hypothetical protein ACYDEJ_13450, partial [Desulfitobacteriaceae bacterium]
NTSFRLFKMLTIASLINLSKASTPYIIRAMDGAPFLRYLSYNFELPTYVADTTISLGITDVVSVIPPLSEIHSKVKLLKAYTYYFNKLTSIPSSGQEKGSEYFDPLNNWKWLF